jgi:hypothetical protein
VQTEEQRAKDRARYARLTEEQKAAKRELHRKNAARRAQEKWAAMSPAEKAEKIAQLQDQEKDYESYIGYGMPEPGEPVPVICRGCGDELTWKRIGNFCCQLCADNYQKDIDKHVKPGAEGCDAPLPTVTAWYKPGCMTRKSR